MAAGGVVRPLPHLPTGTDPGGYLGYLIFLCHFIKVCIALGLCVTS